MQTIRKLWGFGRFSIEGFFISILTNRLLHGTMLARGTDMKNYELLFINEEEMNCLGNKYEAIALDLMMKNNN